MNKVVLVGAGGKMGCRITDNLKDSDYDMAYLEVSPEGIKKLKEKGITVSNPDDVIPEADYIILGVPDVVIKKVAAEVVAKAKPDARILTLDPAAPHAGHLPEGSDVAYFVTHPCHPSIFNWEPDEKNHRDYFGGYTAKQAIVCALLQGNDADYDACEKLATQMYAPVFRSHKITVEQMALLEPALAETMAATLLATLREGMDEVVSQGVPLDAARDFILGHMNIELAVLFNEIPGVFSDACNKAIARAKPLIFQDNWRDIFKPEDIKVQIKDITT